MLANHEGQDLIVHSKAVANMAMAEKLGLDKDLKEEVYSAGLYHDIGKAFPPFQEYVKNMGLSK
jgi:putative nucleotidyltransferase with HDIG domain